MRTLLRLTQEAETGSEHVMAVRSRAEVLTWPGRSETFGAGNGLTLKDGTRLAQME